MISVIIMGVDVVEVAGKFVEAFFQRSSGCIFVTQSPLANQACMITRIAQYLSHCQVLWPQSLAAVTANKCVAGVQAGHQRATRRSTNSASRVEIRETNSLRCEFVQIRGLNSGLAIATQITIAKIIGDNQDDVR